MKPDYKDLVEWLKKKIEWATNYLNDLNLRESESAESSLLREDIEMLGAILSALEKMKIERKDLEIEARHLFEWAMGFPPDDLDSELWADQLEELAERLGQPALVGPEPMTKKSWMKLAEELNVPFSAVKIIREKMMVELNGPGEGERKEMWHWVESWRNLCRDGMVHGCDKCKLTENGQLSKPKCDEYRDKIRDIIMGKGAADASKD